MKDSVLAAGDVLSRPTDPINVMFCVLNIELIRLGNLECSCQQVIEKPKKLTSA